MAKWRNKIETAMYTIVNNVPSVQSTFIFQESFVLFINVLNDGSETKNIYVQKMNKPIDRCSSPS